MANPLDDIVTEDGVRIRDGRIVVTPEGANGNDLERDRVAAIAPSVPNRLVQAVAPQAESNPLSEAIARLRDYLLNPEGFSSGNPTANRVVNRLLGTGGEERVQTWPERMVRSGLSLPGDVASGAEPFYVTDETTGERTISPRVIERAMDTAGMMVPGALSNKPGAATLGSGPVRPAAAMPKSEAPTFYSALEHNVINAPQAVMEPQQWLGWLKKQPGVKQEELTWTGLEDWLAGQKGKVKQEDVQRYLDEHKVEIKDVTKGQRSLDDLSAQQRRDLADDWREFNSLDDNVVPNRQDLENHLAMMDEEYAGVNSTKYQKYQLPGGENYREHLLTLPSKETRGVSEWYRDVYRKPQDPERFYDLSPGLQSTVERIYNEAQRNLPSDYKSSHWDEPNVLAHVRTNDRVTPRDNKGLLPEDRQALADYRAELAKLMEPFNKEQIEYYKKWEGDKWLDPNRPEPPNPYQYTQRPEFKALEKRLENYGIDRLMKLEEHGDTDLVPTLHLEEIQSDWHQQSRKSGYTPAPAEVKRLGSEADAAEKALRDMYDALPDRHRPTKDETWSDIERIRKGKDPVYVNPDSVRALIDDYRTKFEAHERATGGNVLTGRKGTVPDAPFKTAWPELALKRMIRMAAEEGKTRISWTPGEAQAARYDLSKQIDRVLWSPEGKKFMAFDKDKNVVMEQSATAEQLPNIIGKEAADKLINKPTKINDLGKAKQHVLENADLKVGGEGMKGFYDDMLPKMVEKLGKKYGVKVKKTTVYDPATVTKDPAKDSSHEVWYFDIPDAWRDQALGKGFPLFQAGVPFPLTPVDYDPFAKKERE